jgi:hypothetical protein
MCRSFTRCLDASAPQQRKQLFFTTNEKLIAEAVVHDAAKPMRQYANEKMAAARKDFEN